MAFQNFDFQGQIPMAAIVQAYQQRAAQEQQMKMQAEQMKRQKFQDTIAAFKTGASAVQGLVEASRNKDLISKRNSLAQLLGAANKPLTRALPQAGLVKDRPDYTSKVISQFQQAYPGMSGKAMAPQIAKQMFPSNQPTTLARSTESFVIMNLQRGKYGDPNSKEAKQKAIKEWTELDPNVLTYEDTEGQKHLYNKLTGQDMILGGPQGVEGGEKKKRIHYTPAERKEIQLAVKEYSQHPYIKESRKILPTFDTIRELVQKNPKGAIGVIETRQAKQVAGEAGRLTNEDISRNRVSRNWVDGFKQWLNTGMKAELTPETQRRYIRILDIIQNKRSESMSDILNEYTDNVISFGVSNANKEGIRKRIGRGDINLIKKYKVDQSKLTAEQEAKQIIESLLGD